MEKLRASDLENLYGIKQHNAYALARKKRIPHTKLGRTVIFDKDELDVWYKKFKVKTN